MAALHLFERPQHEAAGLLKRGVPVFVSVNPVEYHGPHLSLHNDRLISLGLAADIHDRLHNTRPDWPFVLAADLEVGVGPTYGPGTRYFEFREVDRIIQEACRSLLTLGAKNVVFMTFHGDPLHNQAIHRGVELIRKHGGKALSPFNLLLQDMLHLDQRFDLDAPPFSAAFEHIKDDDLRAQLKRELQFDFHAGFFETSVALHYAPDSVSSIYPTLPRCPPIVRDKRWALLMDTAKHIASSRLTELVPLLGQLDVIARELAFAAEAYGWHALDPFPGYTGQPAHASAAAGQVFARYMVEVFTAETERVLLGDEAPPRPILTWADTLSFGGRIGQSRLSDTAVVVAEALTRFAQKRADEDRRAHSRRPGAT